jgi:hypothetical protein
VTSNQLYDSKLKVFIIVSHATRKNLYARWHIPCHTLFPRREGEQSEMYPFNIVSRASNGGDSVGSGISSRYRAGARIYRDRVLCEGSKSKSKSLLDYQFPLAG